MAKECVFYLAMFMLWEGSDSSTMRYTDTALTMPLKAGSDILDTLYARQRVAHIVSISTNLGRSQATPPDALHC